MAQKILNRAIERQQKKQVSRAEHSVTNAERAAHVAEILKALAHPLRIQIVAILVEGPQHVSALAERLEVNQSIISQQLRILRMRGLVRAVREDGFSHYHIAEPQLRQLVQCMEGCSIS